MRGISIEERATKLAHYIIETKETVRSTAKTFGISKSTVHTDLTLWNGLEIGQGVGVLNDPFPESIEIKKVFLAEKNPVVKLGLVIK